jgi:hypothetical protein
MTWLTTLGIIFVRAGTILLLAIALLYIGAGYPYLTRGLLNIDPALSGEVKAIWLAFCFQLILIAVLLLMYSRRRSPQKVLLGLCGSVLFIDAMLVRSFVSSFYLPAQFLMITGLIILLGCFFITWEGVVHKPTQLTSS